MQPFNTTAHRRRRPVLAVLLAMVMALPAVTASPSADADEPVEEVTVLCIYKGEDVFWAASADACKSSDQVVHLPGDYPLFLCAEVGDKVRWSTIPSCEDRDHTLITVPDDGPVILCAKNRKNGQLDKERAEVTWEHSPLDCGPPKYYAPYVTPTPPVAVDDAYSIDEDSLLDVPAGGVLENDSDYNPGTVVVTLLTQPAVGTVALNADGSFTYEPRGLFDHLDVHESEQVSFTYEISDGGLVSDPATVTLTITGRNDAPVGAAENYSTDEDTLLHVVPPGVLGNDADAEGHHLTAHLVDPPAAGDLELAPDGSLDYDPSAAFQHLGSGDQVSVGFTYVARDGSADSGATAVSINVHGVNDAPVGVDDEQSTTENSTLLITPQLLVGNDTDAEGDTLTAVDFGVGNPSSSFIPNGDGTITFDPRTDFDYLSDGQTAFATLSYRASDGQDTSATTLLRIAVSGVSAAIARDDHAETTEDAPVDIDILANDQVAGASVALQQGSRGVASWDGTVATFDPAGDYDYLGPGDTALARFTYHLTNVEGQSRTAVVSVIVQGVNDPPAAQNQQYNSVDPGRVTSRDATQGVLWDARDPDTPREELSARLIAPPERGRLTLLADGSFTFDPAGEMSENDEVVFRYRASDGVSESPTRQANLSVRADMPPTVTEETIPLIDDGEPASVAVQVRANDPEGEPLTFRLNPPSPHFAINPVTGVLTLTAGFPAPDDYPLTVEVTDSQNQVATGVVTIRVLVPLTPSDDAFDVVGNTLVLAGPSAPPAGGAAITLEFADGVLANDANPGEDVDVLDPGIRTTRLGGQADLRADGSFAYRPPRPDPAPARGSDTCDPATSAWDGTLPAADTFTYQVRDPADDVVTTLTVTLNLVDTVWYVDSEASGPGCGTSEQPFRSTSSLLGPDDDLPADLIFLRGAGRAAYPDAIQLEPRQRLLGEGTALIAGGHLLLEASEFPVVAETVHMGGSNVLAGFDIESPAVGLSGSGIGADNLVDLRSVAGVDGAVLLSGGGGTIAIQSVSSSGSANGVHLSRIEGTVSLGAVELQGPFVVAGGTGQIQAQDVKLTGPEGLQVLGEAPMVAIGSLTAAVAGTALDVTGAPDGSGPDVTVGVLDTRGGAIGLHAHEGTGTVQIDAVAIADPGTHGVHAESFGGTLRLLDGTISATPGALGGSLLRVEGGTPDLSSSARLDLGSSGDAPTGLVGRSAEISGLGDTAKVVQGGAVTDRGLGVHVHGNLPGASVRLDGPVDVATTDTAALRASGTPLAMTAAGNVLRAETAAALSLDSVTIPADGIRVAEASSSAATFKEGSPDEVGYGVELTSVAPGISGAGRLVIEGGAISNPALGGVRISKSTAVTLGALAVTEPQAGGNGVELDNTFDIQLAGTDIARADGNGVRSEGDEQLSLDSVQIDLSDEHGLHLIDPVGTTSLRNVSISESRRTQLYVDLSPHDLGPGDPRVTSSVVAEALVVGSTPAEVDGIRFDARRGNAIDFTVSGAVPSASFGGRHALAAVVHPDAEMDLSVDAFAAGNAVGDAILLQATQLADQPARLSFALRNSTAQTSGGILGAELAGIHLVSRGGASVEGSVADVEINGTVEHGLRVDGAGPVDVTDLMVRAPEQIGVGIYNTPHRIAFDRLDVAGAPSDHAVLLYGAESIDIVDSRVDLTALPDPDAGPEPPPWVPDAVEEHCTTTDNAGTNRADGVAGIYARHVTDLAINDTTVRGATLHQIVVWAGDSIPTIDEDFGDLIPEHGTGDMTLHASGLLVLNGRVNRAGLLAGSSPSSISASPVRLVVDFGTAQTDSVGAHLLCATDLGTVHVQGGPRIFMTESEPALILKSSGSSMPFLQLHSRLTYDLDGTHIEYADTTPDRPDVTVLELISEFDGFLDGTLKNTTIIHAPGDGFGLTGVEDLQITGLTLHRPRGHGLVIIDSSRVGITNLTVTDPRIHGVLVTGSDTISITTSDISGAGAAGYSIADSRVIGLNAPEIADPDGPAVDARSVAGLTIWSGSFCGEPLDETRPAWTDACPTTPSEEALAAGGRPGLRAFNVQPLWVRDLEVGTFTDSGVVAVNGCEFDGYADFPSPEDPTGDPCPSQTGCAPQCEEPVTPLACDAAPCTDGLSLGSITSIGTPAGLPAVLVGIGRGSGGEILLTGRDDGPHGASELDGPWRITSDSNLPVSVRGGDPDPGGGDPPVPGPHLDFSSPTDGLVVGTTTGASVDLALFEARLSRLADGEVGGNGLVVDVGTIEVLGGSIGWRGAAGLRARTPRTVVLEGVSVSNPEGVGVDVAGASSLLLRGVTVDDTRLDGLRVVDTDALAVESGDLQFSDDAMVGFAGTSVPLALTKTVMPELVPSSGGEVLYRATMTNTSSESVEVEALMDSAFGDVNDPGNTAIADGDVDGSDGCAALALPLALAPGDTATCVFRVELASQAAGTTHDNTLTAAVDDDADDSSPVVEVDDDASVAFSDAVPSVAVTKGAIPEVVDTAGGEVVYRVAVANSSIRPMVLHALLDDTFGDVGDPANPAISDGDADGRDGCADLSLPLRLAAAGEDGDSISCAFRATLAGQAAGTSHTSTLTASVAAPSAAGPALFRGIGGTAVSAAGVGNATVDGADVRGAHDGIWVHSALTASVRNSAIDATGLNGIHVLGTPSVRIADNTVAAARLAVAVDGGGAFGQCTTLTGNEAAGGTHSFSLHDAGLDNQSFGEPVEDWLQRNGNAFTPGSVAASNHSPCTQ